MRRALRSDLLEAELLGGPGPWTGVRVLANVDSTNAEVVRQGRPWLPVVADHQEGGRGRLGRTWVDVPRSALAMSVLLPAPPAPGWLPLAAGLAVHRAVAETTGVETVLKWPNDVLVPADDLRKVCGVLCELTPAGVVVGAGVNVDGGREELPVPTATSLALAGAGEVPRERLAARYLTHLAELHAALAAPEGDAVREVRRAYRAVCSTVGADVELVGATGIRGSGGSGGTVRTRALAVDDDGRLVVATPGGSTTVAAGDVTHVRPPQPR